MKRFALVILSLFFFALQSGLAAHVHFCDDHCKKSRCTEESDCEGDCCAADDCFYQPKQVDNVVAGSKTSKLGAAPYKGIDDFFSLDGFSAEENFYTKPPPPKGRKQLWRLYAKYIFYG